MKSSSSLHWIQRKTARPRIGQRVLLLAGDFILLGRRVKRSTYADSSDFEIFGVTAWAALPDAKDLRARLDRQKTIRRSQRR